MADFELERNGQPGTPDGPNTAVRWGLLLSVALHAGAVALLVTGAEPPVYHAPASPIDVTFIEPGQASDPEPSEAPAPPSAAASAAQDEKRAAEKPLQPADKPAAEAPTPVPAPQPVPQPAQEDAAEPAPQPVAAAPPSSPPPAPRHRPPPSKPAEAKPVHAAPPPPSDAAAATPLDSLPNAYAGLIKTRIALAMIYPEKPGRDRRQALVVVRFHIMADGSVTNLAVVRSSGRDILDRAAEDTIRHSTPFPPIPATVSSRWIDMTVTMKY